MLLKNHPELDVNYFDEIEPNPAPPFVISCHCTNVEATKVLLATLNNEEEGKRVDINLIGDPDADYNEELQSGLHYAVYCNSLEITKLILETLKFDDPKRRINLKAKNAKNQTPLDLAKELNHKEIYDVLLPYYDASPSNL